MMPIRKLLILATSLNVSHHDVTTTFRRTQRTPRSTYLVGENVRPSRFSPSGVHKVCTQMLGIFGPPCPNLSADLYYKINSTSYFVSFSPTPSHPPDAFILYGCKEREMSSSCVRLCFQFLRFMLTVASHMETKKTAYLVPAETSDSVRVPVHGTQLKLKYTRSRRSLFCAQCTPTR